MPSWSETHDFLRHRFRLEDLAAAPPERLALTFVTQLIPGRSEAQRVVGQHEIHNDESLLLARADACAEATLAAGDAVTLAARLRIGAIALVDGVYEVRRAFLLRDLNFEDLARDLQYLAMEASFVRAKARPLPGQPEPSAAPKPEGARAEQSESGVAMGTAAAAAADSAAVANCAAGGDSVAASDSASVSAPPSAPPGGHWAD